MTTIDARGLACPGPVARTKAFIEGNSPHRISIAVDNEAALQNVERFLTSKGYDMQVGQTTNMLDIVTAMQLAEKVIVI